MSFHAIIASKKHIVLPAVLQILMRDEKQHGEDYCYAATPNRLTCDSDSIKQVPLTGLSAWYSLERDLLVSLLVIIDRFKAARLQDSVASSVLPGASLQLGERSLSRPSR